MRKCIAKYLNEGSWVWIEGWFHTWAPWYDEYENGPGNYMEALVEENNGQMRRCYVDSVKFTDTTEPLPHNQIGYDR